MRLTYLLSTGLVVLSVASCRTDRVHHPPGYHSYDTLRKYSYLLIMIGPTSATDHTPVRHSNGTGFFYSKDDKLWLVTASHVLTGCPVYGDKEPDTLWYADVWYRNKWGRHCQRVPLHPHKVKDCPVAVERADVDTLEVSAYFKKRHVNTIDSLICNDCDEIDTLRVNDSVVCYGYSNVDSVIPLNVNPASYLPRGPETHFARCIGTPDNEKDIRMQTFYYFVSPKLFSGASGAPIFRIRYDSSGKKRVDFIGIQSGSRKTSNYSTIVKKGALQTLLPN